MERQIRLMHTNITEIKFSADEGIIKGFTTIDGSTTELTFANGFSSNDNSSFAVIFELEIEGAKGEFSLHLKTSSHFETNLPIDQEFKDSKFVKINAPAIAFPYVRAIVSNITLNCGYNPIILPSYNFVNLAEGK